MAATYLDDIIASHLATASLDAREWQSRLGETVYSGPSMYSALSMSNGRVKVIAEVKRKSPSKGVLNPNLVAEDLAVVYESSGASAISVLTDEKFFGGSVDDLEMVRRAVQIPVLRKDFTVCENDVIDCAHMGASTVLLIVAALSDEQLSRYIALAHSIGLDALVEVHDQDEAQRALDAGAKIVGINQRNLRTFEVDVELAERVVSSLPSGIIKVCESGLKTQQDVERASEAGFDAVLVGETFVTAASPSETVRAFSTVAHK